MLIKLNSEGLTKDCACSFDTKTGKLTIREEYYEKLRRENDDIDYEGYLEGSKDLSIGITYYDFGNPERNLAVYRLLSESLEQKFTILTLDISRPLKTDESIWLRLKFNQIIKYLIILNITLINQF